MINYIIHRLLLMIPTLIGVTAVSFFVMAYSPGGVVGPTMNLEGEMDAKSAQALRDYYNKRYGLDKPRPVQYVMWLNRVSPIGFETEDDNTLGSFRFLKPPDFGYSFSRNRPVTELFIEALPVTLTLNILTVPIVFMIPILIGVYAARFRGGKFDTISGAVLLALWSFPVILAGVLLIGFLANKQYLHWFPTHGWSSAEAADMAFLPSWDPDGFVRGWLLDRCWHLVLPMICMTYGGLAFLAKLTRGSVLENMSADFVRTARAKGVGGRRILFTHVLRNSLLPLITVAAGIIPSLIGGSLIIEVIFSLPGMGKLMIEAISARDRELVLANVLFGGMLGLFFQIVRDIAYAVADPRVSYE